MSKKIIFTEEDRIAIIAPHPDDECMFAAGVLLLASDRTDIFVLTDGSHGNKEHSIKEEAAIRKNQFDAEMAYIKPHAVTWFGIEDTKLSENALPPIPGFFFPGLKACILITERRRQCV